MRYPAFRNRENWTYEIRRVGNMSTNERNGMYLSESRSANSALILFLNAFF